MSMPQGVHTGGSAMTKKRLVHPEDVPLVHLRTEEFCKELLHTWQFHEQGRRRFLGLLDQRRRVEVSLGVIHGEYKGRFPFPHQDVAHNQGTSTMIPFDVKLWLTQDADIDAGGTLPGRLLFMLIIPA